MPDKWEYPWYAAWDLAFHCVVLAHTRSRRRRSTSCCCCAASGTCTRTASCPAYEWDFGDVNPPVHAWAALAVFRIDGGTDFEFLARVFHKLLINFTWWVNRKDALGDNIFEGGFLGLDNIGPFDRSAMLPGGGVLEQSDGTAWMAKFCLNMLEMALRLANHDRAYEDVALKFFEHFASIAAAMSELWDEEDGFFYDRLRMPDGSTRAAAGALDGRAAADLRRGGARRASLWERLPDFRARARWFIDHKPELAALPALLRAGRAPRADRARRRAAAAARARAHARRGRVPLALRPALAVALSPRAPARRRRCRAARRASTTSRRSRGAGSSAATRTGAARSGSR